MKTQETTQELVERPLHRLVSQRRTATVLAGVHWDEILKAVEEITVRDGPEYFAPWDAIQLENAAKRIRAKLANAEVSA